MKGKISSSIKAYIAGFLDGEGCIRLARHQHQMFKWEKQVRFINTNRAILAWIRLFYGGRLYQVKRYSSKHKHSYLLVICRKQEVIRLLFDLLPYLHIKRPQAKNLLKFMALQGLIPGGQQLRKLRLAPKRAQLEKRRAALCLIHKKLNKKGPR